MSKIYKESIETLKKLIESVIKGEEVAVYLFGSRATGKADYNSDIDIGIICKSENSEKIIAILREKIENSNIPYKVDVVDLTKVSEEFKRKVLEEGELLWRN